MPCARQPGGLACATVACIRSKWVGGWQECVAVVLVWLPLSIQDHPALISRLSCSQFKSILTLADVQPLLWLLPFSQRPAVSLISQGLDKIENRQQYPEQYNMWQNNPAQFIIDDHAPVRCACCARCCPALRSAQAPCMLRAVAQRLGGAAAAQEGEGAEEGGEEEDGMEEEGEEAEQLLCRAVPWLQVPGRLEHSSQLASWQ